MSRDASVRAAGRLAGGISSARTTRQEAPAAIFRSEHRFFSGAAISLAVLVAIGFGFSTYVRTRPGATAFGGPTLPPLVRAHAAVSTSWVLLLVTQTWLVASRRTRIHRRLGIAGAILATTVVVLGGLIATRQVAHAGGNAAPGVPGSLEFLILPVSELVVFSILTALALYWRRSPRIHKRLMLLGTIALIPAATTRPVPPGSLGMTLGMYGLPELLFVVALMAHDLRTTRRLDPATIAGGALVLIVAVLRTPLAYTPGWSAIAAAISR